MTIIEIEVNDYDEEFDSIFENINIISCNGVCK